MKAWRFPGVCRGQGNRMLAADAPQTEMLVQWVWSVNLAVRAGLGALQGQGPRLACFSPAMALSKYLIKRK